MRIPAPEVAARPAEPHEIPRGAATVLKTARKHGWDARATYARGPWLDADGSFNRMATSILVRASRPDAPAVAACWITKRDGSFTFEFARMSGNPRRLSSAALNATLKQYDRPAEQPSLLGDAA